MLKIRIPKRKLFSITSDSYKEDKVRFALSRPAGGSEIITIKDLSAKSVFTVLSALKIPINIYEKDGIKVAAKDIATSASAYSNVRNEFIPTVFVSDTEDPITFADRFCIEYTGLTHRKIEEQLSTKPGFVSANYYYITSASHILAYSAYGVFLLKGKDCNIVVHPDHFRYFSSNFYDPDQPADLGWQKKTLKTLDEIAILSDEFTFSYQYTDGYKIPGGVGDRAHLVHKKNKVKIYREYTKKLQIQNLQVASLQDYTVASFLVPSFDKTGKDLSAANKMLTITKDYSIKGFAKLKVDDKYIQVRDMLADIYADHRDQIRANIKTVFGATSNIYFDDGSDVYGRYNEKIHQLLYNSSSKQPQGTKSLILHPTADSSGIVTTKRELSTLEANEEASSKVFFTFCANACILEKALLSLPLDIKLSAKTSESTTFQFDLLKLYLYGIAMLENFSPTKDGATIISNTFSYQSVKCNSALLGLQFLPIRFYLKKSRAFMILSKCQDSTVLSRPLEPTKRIKNKAQASQALMTNKELAEALGCAKEEDVENLYKKFVNGIFTADPSKTPDEFTDDLKKL